jgi:hypothetical protein
MQKNLLNRPQSLIDLINAMLRKKQEERPSIKQLFLDFPTLQDAIFDLLQEFLPLKNFIFEKLIL